MKKLINNPSGLVREMFEGAARQAPGTAILGDEHVLVRNDLPAAERRPVAVISGGGSGHEPAHAGYVGAGMLSAAVCGEVFTSPSTDAVLAAIRATAGPNGALLIVKNYTGDRLNFGLAAELARAEGIPVEIAIVADDVSLRRHTPRERRRGIAGTVLVHKIAGAAAALGLPLAQVAAAAREAAAQLGSMGVALGGCTLPGAEKSGFTLADNEIELGLGIHGEKGVERSAMLPADQLTATLLDYIVEDMGLAAGARVALLVNGLGATPQMELDVVMRAAYDKLAARGIAVERAWSGTLLSALDMPGCSLSVLRVDDGRLALLDAATGARAWPGGGRVNQDIHVAAPAMEQGEAQAVPDAAGQRWIAALKPALGAAAAALHAKEPTLTELDSLAGDGDLGASMKRAADAILAVPDAALANPAGALAALGGALRKAIAGSSGPFYATALLRASRRLAQGAQPSARDWAGAFSDAVQAVSDLGGAKAGDRTMLDALFPAAAAFEQGLAQGATPAVAFAAAVEAAEQGAQATAAMAPRAGRASYLGERAVGAPDGGAVAVACWLAALRPHVGSV
ncbi:dihydroxyacetone kinase family protein [Achromobacter sp. AONIH1]|uniref:dihydroxyacetone kinase family protein n=1 Tax=Achromobacter sp. AONIH1 TaxID=1758194 RepID=UPI000CD0D4DA|nr:dihydroxyacetone kinase family protein [Achromobacter sp. AONIH1]AUT47285.1 dihydroxyacetone kinase subunit DhaK [Achromobacter sp. AONIH1]